MLFNTSLFEVISKCLYLVMSGGFLMSVPCYFRWFLTVNTLLHLVVFRCMFVISVNFYVS